MNSTPKTNSLDQLNSLKQKELIKYSHMLKKYTPSVAQLSQDPQISDPIPLESSLCLAFGSLSEQFSLPSINDIHTLDTVSTIIYKLVSSFNQIKATEIKSQELLLKEKEFLLKKEALEMKKNHLQPENAKGLTPETLCLIEQQLKLL